MRDRSGLRLLGLIAVLAMLAAACGGGGTGTGTEGTETPGDAETTPTDEGTEAAEGGDADVLVVGALEKPSGLDPAKIYEKFASDILFNTTNRLVEFAPGETEVGPGLAEDWEISEDGLTYTFTLREGVTFHDGSEFDSEDVKFSLERALNMNHPEGAAFLISAIQSIETPDPQTVVITIDEPNVTFLSRLNYTVASILPSDSDVYSAPEAVLEGEGEVDEFVVDDQIVGTGPYMLEDYQPGTSITLRRFDDYWGEPAQIETVRIQFFEDSAQMKNALDAGEIDLNMNEFGPAERASLEGNADVTVFEGPGARIRYIVFDVNQAPFDDPAVRRSISAAIDRERIIEEVFEGAGEPLFSMIPSGFEGAHADEMSDLEVEVSGDPIEFDLWYPLNKYGDTEPDVAETIARSLNETGQFNVTTRSADWATEYASNLSTGTYGAYLLGWYPDYFDPDDYIEPFYSSEGFIGFYNNPRMDELITQEQAETDSDARNEIFAEIQVLAAEEMPFVPLYEEAPFAYYRNGLTGVEDTVDPVQQTRYWVIGKS
jgi:peptide/nickel transport system substrate-binding protein